MPRLSLWKEGKHTHDFEFHDRLINEQFTVGGTTIHIHKYLGPLETEGSNDDATQPDFIDPTETDIQDILFLENRDRKYDPDVYNLRGMYRMNDNDFDLSQFGLFLSSDTMFITFHLKTMYDAIGRKIMAGDVLELPHLKEYYALDEDIPSALRRYYMVQDASRPAEGYSPTWWPHLWRVKVTPLVDAQETANLFEQLGLDGEPKDDILADPDEDLLDIISNEDALTEINDGIVEQAEADVPGSGYDTSEFYVAPITEEGDHREPENLRASMTILPGTDTPITADNGSLTADSTGTSPEQNIAGGAISGTYILGDGLAPNGYPVLETIEFPDDAIVGDFVLRIDYLPNRLFRFDGSHWIKMEDKMRTPLTAADRQTQLSEFQNNDTVTDGSHNDKCAGTFEERQALSQILRPKADN
jgi:hypothetical protein